MKENKSLEKEILRLERDVEGLLILHIDREDDPNRKGEEDSVGWSASDEIKEVILKELKSQFGDKNSLQDFGHLFRDAIDTIESCNK